MNYPIRLSENKPVECAECGRRFIRGQTAQHYCSKECADIAKKKCQARWLARKIPELEKQRDRAFLEENGKA